jgi:hypothetical protein
MKQDAKTFVQLSSRTCAQLDTSLLNLLPDTFGETRFFSARHGPITFGTSCDAKSHIFSQKPGF